MAAALMPALKRWVVARNNPLARAVYGAGLMARYGSLPPVPYLHAGLYAAHGAVWGAWSNALRILWYTPLFQSRLQNPARRLYLYGGMPLVQGPLRISIGEGCRISAASTFSGRSSSNPPPQLIIGDNVDIGWQTTISAGRRVIIGDNVRIAGRAFLAGYPGHPLEARARAAGAPDLDEQTGDIILEDDVWLGLGVTVTARVRIGRGTIVAAGSVVTKDLPPFVLAGGVPARVLRSLPES
jgi:acetyltransferase-like isoleucine patch superfamily enzyme